MGNACCSKNKNLDVGESKSNQTIQIIDSQSLSDGMLHDHVPLQTIII